LGKHECACLHACILHAAPNPSPLFSTLCLSYLVPVVPGNVHIERLLSLRPSLHRQLVRRLGIDQVVVVLLLDVRIERRVVAGQLRREEGGGGGEFERKQGVR
jgi:hypothetical protein